MMIQRSFSGAPTRLLFAVGPVKPRRPAKREWCVCLEYGVQLAYVCGLERTVVDWVEAKEAQPFTYGEARNAKKKLLATYPEHAGHLKIRRL